MMKVVASVLVILVALCGALGLFVYSGAYNIAATEDHTSIVRWALHTMMENSVHAHARDIKAPAPLAEPGLIDKGAEHFIKGPCAMCHGAPGEAPAEWAKGIKPPPPDLSQHVPQWSDGELFWIVKHGIKMTAMPSFATTHSDEDLWAIVAFLRQLPQMSPAKYGEWKQLVAASHPAARDHHSGASP